MVRGLEHFLDFFSDWKSSFAVIGGCACSQWCEESAVRFRSTQDIDMVLLLEAKASGFFTRFWEYIRDGRYDLRRRANDESTVLFRFERPGAGAVFPKQIEVLTGVPNLEIPNDVRIVHLGEEDERYSLSAILLQEDYYKLVASSGAVTRNGMPTVRPDVLAILKAKAHLNLLAEKLTGQFVSDHDLRKHRNDVFQLAYLPVKEDIMAFLRQYSASNPEWSEIQAHLRAFGMETKDPAELLQLMRNHFGIG